MVLKVKVLYYIMKLRESNKYMYTINTILLILFIILEYYFKFNIPNFITYLLIVFFCFTILNNFFIKKDMKNYNDFLGLKFLNSGKFLLGLAIMVTVYNSINESPRLHLYLFLSYSFYMITTLRIKRGTNGNGSN